VGAAWRGAAQRTTVAPTLGLCWSHGVEGAQGGLELATGPRELWASRGENERGKKTGPAAQDGLLVRGENRKEMVKGRVGRLGRCDFEPTRLWKILKTFLFTILIQIQIRFKF
jgi:hypothetical protein